MEWKIQVKYSPQAEVDPNQQNLALPENKKKGRMALRNVLLEDAFNHVRDVVGDHSFQKIVIDKVELK